MSNILIFFVNFARILAPTLFLTPTLILTLPVFISPLFQGTFCFKPARKVRWTQANFYAFSGFILEWVQHTLYVLPVGIVTGSSQVTAAYFIDSISLDSPSSN
jgi:hypothetical protein